jgi:hypothetical protein
MALSSYLPLAESLPHEVPAANEETPIFTRSLRPGRTA